MKEFLDVCGEIITYAAEIGVVMAEVIGIVILVTELIRGLIAYIKGDNHHHIVGKGISSGLSFLLVGEALHTVHSESMQDLLVLGMVILLRVAITVLLWWEGKHMTDE